MKLGLMRRADFYMGIPLCFILGVADKFIRKLRPSLRKKSSINKILLVKTWGVGNMVMMLPTMQAIRDFFPEAKITLLTLRVNEGMVEGNPFLDNELFLKVKKGVGEFIRGSLQIISSLRQEKFDLVLDFDQFSRVAALFTFFSRARERIGFDTKGQGKAFVFTRKVPYNNHQHMALTYFDIAKAVGVEEKNLDPIRITLSDKDVRTAGAFLRNNGIGEQDVLVGIHPGSGDNFPERRWPKERFARLANILMDKYGVKVIFTGGKGEVSLVKKTNELIDNRAVDGSGRFSLKELAAVIDRCNLFFSNDTAPLHIASTMGTPVVGFYGPNTPLLYGPRGENNLVFYKELACSPCMTNFNAKHSDCRHPKCMLDIKVEEVSKKVEKNYFSKNADLFCSLR